MERSSMASQSRYHLPPAELSSHSEEAAWEEEEEEAEGVDEEVSEVVVVVEAPTLTLREEIGPAQTALVAT